MRLRDIFWIIDTKNSRALITKWAEKAGKDAEKVISYVEETYKETNDQLAAGKWICEGYEPKQFPQALYICKQKKLDPLKENPSQLIQDNPDVKPKEKAINPDTVLSDRQEDGEGNVTYAARDEDREVLRQLINTHYGIDANPWCLLQADKDGKLTDGSMEMWKYYNAYPKRIAFRDGKLLAFSAGTNEDVREWWDRFDRSFPMIPYDGKRWLGRNGGTYEIRKGNVFKTEGSETSRLSTDYSENIEENYSNVKIDTQKHTITDRWGTYPYEEKDGKYVVTNGRQDYTHRAVSFTMNKDLELDGEYVERNSNNGQLLFVKHYANGRLNGVSTSYDGDHVDEKRTFKDGKLEGPYELYHDNGNVRERGTYKNDKLNGVVEYLFAGGQLSDRKIYKDGVKEGPFEAYYENGQLKEKSTYKNGKIDGMFESFYPNGQLHRKCFIKNSMQEGPCESYYENGQLKIKCAYKEDGFVGPCEKYFENGQLRIKCTYNENSELDGLCEIYYENGKLNSRCTYKDGKNDGLYESYHKNGKLEERRTYNNGSLEGLRELYYEDGELLSKGVYKNNKSEGLYEAYHKNGKLEERRTYKNGKLDGPFEMYDAGGELLRRRIYKDDKIVE